MALREFNGTAGDPQSFDLLDRLIEAQPYRLAFWRVAGEEINYRRFFDINELAAIRVELPEVFEATHQLILRFLAKGKRPACVWITQMASGTRQLPPAPASYTTRNPPLEDTLANSIEHRHPVAVMRDVRRFSQRRVAARGLGSLWHDWL
jgi:hypothetical protein